MNSSPSHYVYLVRVNGSIKYVGKGSGDRWRHSTSGASSVPYLNRDYWQGSSMEVYIVTDLHIKTSTDAHQLEREIITTLKNDGVELYNKTGEGRPGILAYDDNAGREFTSWGKLVESIDTRNFI